MEWDWPWSSDSLSEAICKNTSSEICASPKFLKDTLGLTKCLQEIIHGVILMKLSESMTLYLSSHNSHEHKIDVIRLQHGKTEAVMRKRERERGIRLT